MQSLIDLIKTHGTKILGFIGVTIGVLAVADPELVGGPRMIKYYLLGQSLLTVWRGYFNSDAIRTSIAVKSGIQDGSLNVKDDKGFSRVSMLLAIVTTSLFILALSVSGCTHTREAYKEARGSMTDTAYVVAEHYAAMVHEAANLKEQQGTASDLVQAMQRADQIANPAVHKLREARDAYDAVKNAETQEELQRALDDAVRLVADLSRAVSKARGDSV